MKKLKPVLKNFDEILSHYDHKLIIDENIKPLDSNFSEVRQISGFIFGDSYKQIIGGHSEKLFYLCKSNTIKEVFDLVYKGASFVTAHNSAIKEHYNPKLKEFPNEFIPVLIKRIDGLLYSKDLGLSEEISSKIANLFDIPVVYNRYFSYQDEKGENREYILSVDFIEYPKEFDTLSEYVNIKRMSISTFRDLHNMLYSGMKNKKHSSILSDEDVAKLEKDFVEQYLFRRCILQDGDFDSENVGILFNPQAKTYEIAPMFDFEFAFSKYSEDYNDLIMEDLIYLLTNHKEKVVEFANKAKIIREKGLLGKKFFKQFRFDKDMKKESMEIVNRNLDKFCKRYDQALELKGNLSYREITF